MDDFAFIDRVERHAWRKQNANRIRARAIKYYYVIFVSGGGVNEQQTTSCTIESMECHQWHANVRERTAYCVRFIFYYFIHFFLPIFGMCVRAVSLQRIWAFK